MERGAVDSGHFMSGGAKIVGILYRALEAEPGPAAILLHRIPGSEKNLDVAYRLRDLGWHTLIVHFRGGWGSGGDYDMTTQPDDAVAAIDYIAALNPTKIALIGYSLGSRAAILAAHRDRRVGAVVSMAVISMIQRSPRSTHFLDETLSRLLRLLANGMSQQKV